MSEVSQDTLGDKCGYLVGGTSPCGAPRDYHVKDSGHGPILYHRFQLMPREPKSEQSAIATFCEDDLKALQIGTASAVEQQRAAYTIERLEAAQSHSVDITITITIDGGTK